METWGFFRFTGFVLLFVLFLTGKCLASIQTIGTIQPGFQASQMSFIDNSGLFLLSNNTKFALGFVTTSDVTLFLLVIVHMQSSTVVWTANRGSPVANSDDFVFDEKGSVFLRKGDTVVWSAETGGKEVTAMELQDSGNLVLLGNGSRVIWQSFSHPTDTLLSNQDFVEGLTLVSDPSPNNMTYILEINSGDLILSAGFQPPQPYWSMGKDNRKTINKDGGVVTVASLNANSWRFYDKNRVLLWQFIFSDNADTNATWIAVLGNDGFISFYNLQNGQSSGASPTKIPSDQCSTPEPCDAYYICFSGNKCQCPSVLNSLQNCNSGIVSPCDPSKGRTELVNAGNGLNYFALGSFLRPLLSLIWTVAKPPVLLGQGGFGSVYQGALPDGTRVAVKKLEGIGQGKKEFRAEVSTIGSIHHLHLVRIKGFCAEGTHRLLAYEFMANGSLDRWIFGKNRNEFIVDWDTRFNIALGTAKGLAYLHEDCDAKIVHCDKT
ncbi:G-type lectin S-receptor-like serine/threonine-protein kinase SD2-5 [Morella rubra]|uniref:G-type lectin S-receptor-like serine/threonine-protein kinase SD2-5 n=1 Tax=Morella rubra TaxID=262757 RepID=A0A6A1UX09_9ROSI|nr:G-type lectin S-receptor-like serine/threonine-protein kinase SD2-5 [Morella rubra]